MPDARITQKLLGEFPTFASLGVRNAKMDGDTFSTECFLPCLMYHLAEGLVINCPILKSQSVESRQRRLLYTCWEFKFTSELT